MPELLEKLLKYADTIGSIIPLVAAFVVFSKKGIPSQMVPMAWYLFLSFVVYCITNILADRGINNLLFYNVFSVIELVFILEFFRKIIQNSKIKKFITPISILFTAFLILNMTFFEGPDSFNSNAIAIEFTLIIIFSFVFYYEFSNTDAIVFFSKNPIVWIVSGFFIYFSACILTFALYKYAATADREFTLDFWLFQVVMYLLRNIFITKGILCFKTQK